MYRRAASRLPTRALLGSSIAAAVLLDHEPPKEKLSIYPSSTQERILFHTPSPLELKIGVARRHIQHAFTDVHTQAQGLVNRWIAVEHAIESRVKFLIAPDEPLTPGLLYIGIATLTGSIFARNRIILTRTLIPPLFFLLSANHFLPKTSANVSAYLGDVEHQWFPRAAEIHATAKAHSAITWARLRDGTAEARARLQEGSVSTVEKIQALTGLKLQEMLKWRKNVERKVEGVVEAATCVDETAEKDMSMSTETQSVEATRRG